MTTEGEDASGAVRGRIPVGLEYAGRSTERRRPWNVQTRRMCAVTAAVSVAFGLLVREDIGSGRFILNPLRVLAVAALLAAVGVYVTVRIVEDADVPVLVRAAMLVCAGACIALIPIAYNGGNRWRGYRLRRLLYDERFHIPAMGIACFALAFASLRLWVWWRRRRRASLPAGAGDPPAGVS